MFESLKLVFIDLVEHICNLNIVFNNIAKNLYINTLISYL
jgi:hypothetical protein